MLDTPAKTRSRTPHVGTWLEILISSILGLIASLVLSIDAIVLATDPLADLSCNISSKISCGTVGSSWQASVLGFPNAFLGLMCEPVIITIAVASLARVKFPRWFMIAAQAVSSIGFLFAYWLFYQAYFVIGALCPWCLLITVTTTLIFTSFTRLNILQGNYGKRVQGKFGKLVGYYHADVAVAVILISLIAAMVVYKYI